jgi:Sjoegren syndrome nuclear autoantigen 1
MAAEMGADLESTLEKIKQKRYKLMAKMEDDTQLLQSVTAKIDMRADRLDKVTQRRNRRIQAKKEYEKTIMETEAAYKKILESSAILLKSLKEQAGTGKGDEEMLLGKDE